jgi:tRNA/rRNA methyltransferase
MANFGLADLRLVNPRDGWPQERAWASASGAEWPLNAARVYDSVAEAIADLKLVYATTARPRELQLPVLTPREAAANLAAEVAVGRSTGLLFGGERAGLETQDIALCQAIVTLPIDPRFRSLNLAQAAAVVLQRLRVVAMASAESPTRLPTDAMPMDPARRDRLEDLFTAAESLLLEVGFLYPHTAHARMAKLRGLLQRSQVGETEVALLRGMVSQLRWASRHRNP